MQHRNPLVQGAVGGALAGLLVWGVSQAFINKKLGGILEEELPPVIRGELDRKLAEYNITPATGAQIAQLLNRADAWGII